MHPKRVGEIIAPLYQMAKDAIVLPLSALLAYVLAEQTHRVSAVTALRLTSDLSYRLLHLALHCEVYRIFDHTMDDPHHGLGVIDEILYAVLNSTDHHSTHDALNAHHHVSVVNHACLNAGSSVARQIVRDHNLPYYRDDVPEHRHLIDQNAHQTHGLVDRDHPIVHACVAAAFL
jgi:hypothetical protein